VNARLDQRELSVREKLILCGLFLAKFDVSGLKWLGFESFTEAFNALGYSLGAKPASIKNYRDEFDPLFPNPRHGWHKRETRAYCLKVLVEYTNLDLEEFGGFIKSFSGFSLAAEGGDEAISGDDSDSVFARRLITGVAAERYFELRHTEMPEFAGYSVENTTLMGCGYDFRLRPDRAGDFLAVEVKGLREQTGSLLLTPKEHQVATRLTHRYFLCVVANFREVPMHRIFSNPLAGPLSFERTERVVVQVSWTANL